MLGRLLTACAVVAALLVGSAGVFTLAAPALASTTVGPNVNVTRTPGDQAEGAIAVDPANPQLLFASANNNTPGTLNGSFSTDGGATWTSRTIANGSDGMPPACCDSSVSWDSFGNLFLTYLDSNTSNGRVHVMLSTDGGQHFTAIAALGSGGLDQPTVTTGAGSVWVTWTDGQDRISAAGAKVTGQGASHVGAFSAIEHAGDGDFGDIAISPTGAVMVTYLRPHDQTSPSTIYEAVDANGLGSGGFGAEVAVTQVNMAGFTPIPAQHARTVDAEPGLAWDRSGGPHNGRVYLLYTNAPSKGSTDLNIFVRYSDDNGGHWTSPVRVNDDTGTKSQFLPRIALDQTSGKLAVSWYDARNSPGNNTAQLFAATSDDGTSFSPNIQVSAGTSNAATANSNVDYGDYSGLTYTAGTFYPYWADNSNSTHDNPDGAGKAFDMYTAAVTVSTPGPPPPAQATLTYTGPTTADYHDAFTASANLTAAGSPLPGGPVTFTLGSQHCTATTDSAGNAGCSLTPNQAAGVTTLTASYPGDATHTSASVSVSFTITREETSSAYTGPGKVANGVPAHLSGTLKEDGVTPIAGRSLEITLGAGTSRQTCTGTTDASGTARCDIPSVNQPLNAAATVPVTVSFAGDAFYLPSSGSATVLLEYYTGRAFGLSADVNLAVTSLTVKPTPDTGQVRTAQASSTTTPCTLSLDAILVTARTLCPNVTTRLAPGTSTATAAVSDVTIGIPGLPVIGISGLTAKSTSTCGGAGAASGSVTLTLTLAGVPITVPTAPNSAISLPGGARLAINEQTPVPGADFGLTVNAVHLTVPGLTGGNAVDIIIGSATSDVHNCA